ncbi:hypothetical protein MLD38_022533 [Melastoma candidum]|uniref:Uncharacterized protein n=1 Tax=Melastoma candidum TaxID=119954 RepID=A0ACB9QJG5_9MYRT|nr:hypothetical protein MLD38_022533 [Melastoma candidum]
MGRSHFLAIVLVSVLLSSSFHQGIGRRMMEEEEGQATHGGSVIVEMGMRKMVEVMDYSEPEPNTNPRSGFLTIPSPPTR